MLETPRIRHLLTVKAVVTEPAAIEKLLRTLRGEGARARAPPATAEAHA